MEHAPPEAELVERARNGDQNAFTELYDTYVARIYDFCFGMLRNRADAEDVTSQVFLRAVERLGSLRDAAAFRGWLYGIARNASLDLIDRGRREAAMPEGHEPTMSAFTGATPAGPDPAAAAEQSELAGLVWEAAATLDPRDYAVFDMTVRQGLGSGEVAEALGIKPSHAYVLVNRLKGTVEQALGTVVLARAGRKDCAVLDALARDFGDERSPRMRRSVQRHLKACDACRGTRARYAAIPALLQGVAHAAPRPEFTEALRESLGSAWGTRTTQSAAAAGHGRGRRLAVASVAVVALVLAGVLAGATGVGDGPKVRLAVGTAPTGGAATMEAPVPGDLPQSPVGTVGGIVSALTDLPAVPEAPQSEAPREGNRPEPEAASPPTPAQPQKPTGSSTTITTWEGWNPPPPRHDTHEEPEDTTEPDGSPDPGDQLRPGSNDEGSGDDASEGEDPQYR